MYGYSVVVVCIASYCSQVVGIGVVVGSTTRLFFRQNFDGVVLDEFGKWMRERSVYGPEQWEEEETGEEVGFGAWDNHFYKQEQQ